jgi:uncharacterized membrane protein YbaN (DUF454 family)
MIRLFYLVAGMLALAAGGIGLFLPLVPTVPFAILAAFCFARSSPRAEAWLLSRKSIGPHIKAWRERGAINRKGKVAALLAFAGSAVLGLALLKMPWALLPLLAVVIGGSWIATRPEA